MVLIVAPHTSWKDIIVGAGGPECATGKTDKISW